MQERNNKQRGNRDQQQVSEEQKAKHNPFKVKELPEEGPEPLKEEAEQEQQRKDALTERD